MFKKIVSICICIILLISVWLMPASAVEYAKTFPAVGTMFCKLYDMEENLIDSVTSVPLQVGVNPKIYYLFNNGTSNNSVFVNLTLNIKDFTFRKDTEYTVSFDLVFPTPYLSSIRHSFGGLYNWASVDFSNPFATKNYTYVNSGCIYNFSSNMSGALDSSNWQSIDLLNGAELSVFPVSMTFTPSVDIPFKSIFYSLGLSRFGFNAYYGISSPLISYSYSGEVYEEEKAQDGGNANINEALDVIPNDSAEFVDALSNLANSVSYNGTDAKLTIPAMYIPAMNGMGGRINLTNDIEFNFAPYIQMIPSSILLVIQIILTLALIVYCFKELYSIIQMVMVNKGGGE